MEWKEVQQKFEQELKSNHSRACVMVAAKISLNETTFEKDVLKIPKWIAFVNGWGTTCISEYLLNV